MTKERLLNLRDIVTDMKMLNAAVGLNPWVRPGNEAAHMMVNTLSEKVKSNPEILQQYTLTELR